MTHATVHEWGRVAVGDGGFSRAQSDTLLAAARRHPIGGVEGTDILCDHHRHLTARQAVGVLAGRGCSLEILPKLDPAGTDEAAGTIRARLVHMIDVALGLDLSSGEATAMSHRANSLLELFIALFAERLIAEMRRGLPRLYREREDDLGALRGRLQIIRQFTANAVRPDRLACRFDELDSDTPLMRIMKACVVLVARHARAAETQRKLAELRFRLTDVTDVPRTRLPWRDMRIDRTSRRWRTLAELAGLLLGGRWQETHAAAAQPDGISLLFPMNDLFERYVAVQARRALAPLGLEVTAQGGLEYCLGEWNPDGPCRPNAFRTRPDLIVRDGGRTIAVIDSKWKHLAADRLETKAGVAQTDVYQLMAYARLYRCDRLMLLYPAETGEPGGIRRSFGMAHGLERLDIATLDISAGSAGVTQKLRDLVVGLIGAEAGKPVQR